MNRARWLYLSIIIFCLTVIVFTTYYTLGGFDESQVYVFEGGSRTVIGKQFIGDAGSSQIDELVQEARALIDNGRLTGQFVLVEYQNDTIGEDSVHLYIGAALEEIRNVLEIPSGYSYEEFTTDKIYRVFITQHPLVRPFPAEIRSLIEVRAIQEGEVLAPYTFDIYYDDGSLRTEAWVR